MIMVDNTVAIYDSGTIHVCGAIRGAVCGAICETSVVRVFGWGFLKDDCGIAASKPYISLFQPFDILPS